MSETFENVNTSEPFVIVVDHLAPSIAQMAVGAAVSLAFASVSALALNGVNRLIARRNEKADLKRAQKMVADIIENAGQDDPEYETK